MNEQYSTVATTANIIQSVIEVMYALNKANIDVPADSTEVARDAQATIARMIGGTINA